MPLQPRNTLANIRPGIHGGLDYSELERLGIQPDSILDFSVSTSPAGIPPGILENMNVKEFARYPDSQSTGLTRVIAGKLGVSENNIITGNGSTEIIRLAVTAYLEGKDKVLIPGPVYGEYRLACRIAGADILELTASDDNDFRPDIDEIIKLVKQEKPKAVFLCNPNNPTGYYLREDDFLRILSVSSESLVVLDEAYVSFVENRWSSTGLIEKGNLLVVRSMTKDYSIAGLRLGYGVANRDIIDMLRRICPPWNVNTVAQRAGVAALEQDGYQEKSLELASDGKRYLVKELEKLGFYCVPSDANFFLVEVGDAAKMRERLLYKGVMVRDCTSFGLPGYMRIAPRTMKENRRFITVLKELVNE